MSTRMPLPTARRAVPMAAVVLPLPGPVLMTSKPRRESVIEAGRGSKVQGRGDQCKCSVDRSLIPRPTSMAGVIRMPAEDCKCAVDPLGHHQLGQRMGQGELAER